ncbi:hypothetical protein [Salinibacillus xinjiangensis]|uniref:Uncharacterized protein n=1 Tax=Salinibacillus xinjiangensis TaxID=1229268 RepID=A0A6G1X998_9BACI|nr:hypothetical protein [Salinibacillus xinjiangensis]MRG87517.1 hypothetical protein [Salinibacillus xinjiangensis]
MLWLYILIPLTVVFVVAMIFDRKHKVKDPGKLKKQNNHSRNRAISDTESYIRSNHFGGGGNQ